MLFKERTVQIKTGKNLLTTTLAGHLKYLDIYSFYERVTKLPYCPHFERQRKSIHCCQILWSWKEL